MMNCKNEKCGKELAEKLPLHFSNRIARELGFCSFMCMAELEERKKALEMLQNKGNTRNTGKI